MKSFFIVLFLGFICCNNDVKTVADKNYSVTNDEALKYCKDNNFSEDYYFLIDLSLHPGKNRLDRKSVV